MNPIPLAVNMKFIDEGAKVVRFSVSMQTIYGEFLSHGWRFFVDKDEVFKPFYSTGPKRTTASVNCSQDFQNALKAQLKRWLKFRTQEIENQAITDRLRQAFKVNGSWKAVQAQIRESVAIHGEPENASQVAAVIAVELLANASKLLEGD